MFWRIRWGDGNRVEVMERQEMGLLEWKVAARKEWEGPLLSEILRKRTFANKFP